ncbi:hypothetical protein D1007_03227 [Hordeum vulgare]|nr:hypothetical protein D1007_03227 [Hordeum vulgare]
MEGFSPPDRRVAPPPATADYTMLVHVDRIEDWTTPSPRSSHSGQSGLPSSDSDHDNHPFPAVMTASWTMGAEDGQRGARAQRRKHAPVANTGCSGMPRRGHGCDHDGDGGSRGAGQRSWKDVLLGRSRTPARKMLPGAARQRSRSPRRPKSNTQRHGGGKVATAPPPPPPLRHRRSRGRTPAAPAAVPLQGMAFEGGRERTPATRPEVADGGRREGKDPVDDFFREARKTSVASVLADPVVADVQATAEAAIAAPLDFGGDSYFDEDVDEAERVQLDAFSPTLSAATMDCGQFNHATPSATRTMEVQLGAVTSRVCQLEITADDGNLQQHRALFRATEPPILATPAKRPSAPPKSRTAATPTRHSARQAANTSTILVAQRASFRIVKELGLLGPREKLIEDVAKALIRRFEEPLSDSDIVVIAKLTHLDSGALRVMARMAGPDGHAAEADV